MGLKKEDLSVQIQNSTDPTRVRISFEISRTMESYDITVADGKLSDVLRVVDAMYAQGMFVHQDGTPLMKTELMKLVGNMLNVETKNWKQILTRAYQGNTPTLVFKKLLEWGKKRWSEC